MARRTKEDAEKTRQSLIRTALFLFSNKGVASTTLTDIAVAAGVTKGAFYWHFSNKREVFDAIFEEFAVKQDIALEQRIERSAKDVAAMLDAARTFFEQVEHSEELKALYTIIYYKCEFTDEFGSMMDFMQSQDRESVAEIKAYLDALKEEEWLTPDSRDCEKLAQILYDAFGGLLMRLLISDEKGYGDLAVKTAKLILRGGGLKV